LKPSFRLLVVDNEPRMTAALRRLLSRQEAVEVVAAQSGAEALALLRSGAQFDALLIDVVMPGLDGIALYDELQRSHPDVVPRTVMMTSAITPDVDDFQRRTRALVLSKPLDPQTLRAVLGGFRRTRGG
jgi:CheY-like chemotaxis protein